MADFDFAPQERLIDKLLDMSACYLVKTYVSDSRIHTLRELDKLYSECKRYEAILHYPEDMREANESEKLFQGAITLSAFQSYFIMNR